MALLQDTELERDVKKGEIKGIYFLYGAEYTGIERVVSRIIKKTVSQEFSSFNLQKLDEKARAFEISDGYSAFPLMGSRRCITVKNFDFDGIDNNEFKELVSVLENPNDTTVLVFFYVNKEIDVKKSRYKKIIELVQKQGVVTVFSPKDRAYIRRYILDSCKRYNVEIENSVANSIIDRCRENLSVVRTELDKLIMSSVGNDGGRITAEAVRLLCVQTLEDSVFDLANSIIQNRYKQTFNLLNSILVQKSEPIAIIGALNMAFTDIYRAKLGALKNYPAAQIVKDFSYNPRREFVIRNGITTANKFSLKRFNLWFTILLETDIQLKSSRMDNRIILEQMIGRLLQS